jgi:hypothetical protein
MKSNFKFAIDNIIKYGDTDIFPFPIENHIFYDLKDKTIELLYKIFNDFDKFIQGNPPNNESMLTSSGYNGFRWATLIEPIWNAYLLGLVLSISDEIEKARIPKEQNYVFSYRILLDDNEKTIFDKDYGWFQFQNESLKLANEYPFVLTCDISHFYSNIYHHRLENALFEIIKKIHFHIDIFSNQLTCIFFSNLYVE